MPGPGGGGGGGGNESPEPPKKAEIPGKEAVSVPVKPPEAPTPQPKPEDPPPEPELNIPAKSMGEVAEINPGLLDAAMSASTPSQGTGTGGGGGTGQGVGIGSGRGSGLGAGEGGGTGGGVYRPGNGVELPRPIHQPRPNYTADAMRAKVQGTVWVECVVRPDGPARMRPSPNRSTRCSASTRKPSRPPSSGASSWHQVGPARGRARDDRTDLYAAIRTHHRRAHTIDRVAWCSSAASA